ncbi:MAG: hypothetical protein AAF572_05325 [Cyanobacteria bacterium P01_B01_bin.77]
MSLLHLEKSVLRFHFRELLEDGHGGNHLALVGLGVVLLGPKLLPTIAKMSRPVAKKLIKSSYAHRPQMTLSEWVMQSKRSTQSSSMNQRSPSIPLSE